MPEIKNNFTRGKMNKDLDERLIQNGEYRDAMNVQISSTDDSDVGTVQNILGNKELQIPFAAVNLKGNSVCIGATADEKNNKIYYFIAHKNLIEDAGFDQGGWRVLDCDGVSCAGTSWIIRNERAEHLNIGQGNDPNNYGYMEIDAPAIVNGNPYKISYDVVVAAGAATSPQLILANHTTGGSNVNLSGEKEVGRHEQVWLQGPDNQGLIKLWQLNFDGAIDNVVVKHADNLDYILEYDTENDVLTPVFIDALGVLGFDPDKIITGINVLDDMLFWTDNKSEPKKINILNSIKGSAPSADEHTNIVNEAQGFMGGPTSQYFDPPVMEENITVIKKAPLVAPTVVKETFRNKYKFYSAYMEISDSADNPTDIINSSKGRINDFSFLRVGDTFRTYLNGINGATEYALEWKPGDEVVIKEFDEADNAPTTPVVDYTIKGTITNWAENTFATIDPVINKNGNLQSGVDGIPDSWNVFTSDARYKWIWVGGMLSLQSPAFYSNSWPTFPQQAWTFLDEPISPGEEFKITYTVSPPTGGLTTDPLKGNLSVFLIENGHQNQIMQVDGLGDLATYGVSTINTWGTYAFNVTFDNTIAQYGGGGGTSTSTTPISGPTYLKNTLMFQAGIDSSGDIFQGKIDNIIVERVLVSADAQVEIRINSIKKDAMKVLGGNVSNKFMIDLFDQQEKLFEFKFPRFAYRYKYVDGEYSTFSPFSEPTFVPGKFDYHPNKGYNLGMTNTLKSITLKRFLANIPLDVASIDILYKEEDSPNIYIVDTIKSFNNTEYKISSETLKNGLTQSNQLLRIWDNVPRKALGQEIVGSRVVYGNYLQNYDLIDSLSSNNYNIDLLPEILSGSHKGGKGEASIKSLREYQVGVVYSDKYGRQTPILTSTNATVKLTKNKAESINSLRISIGNLGTPVNMDYFKFYIKDNSNQYYNLAMDRYYDAEDENIWIAFPSSDRNKIDIDDFLILKKGSDSNKLIKEAARYKVLDIQNEAPEHIKRNEFLMGTARHSNSFPLFKDGYEPTEGDATFSIDWDVIKSKSYSNLADEFNNRVSDKYYITLSNSTTNKVSDRYEITSLQHENAGAGIDECWNITLKKSFTDEINEFTDDPTGEDSKFILDNTYLNIYKSTIENGPHFDGRFFIKIYNDDVFVRNVVQPDEDRILEYQAIPDGTRKIYGLATETNSDRILRHFDDSSMDHEVFKNTWFDAQNCVDKGFTIEEGHPSLSSAVLTSTQDAHVDRLTWQTYWQATCRIATHVGNGFEGGIFGEDGEDAALWSQGGNNAGSRWAHYDAYFRAFNVQPNGISDRKASLDIHNKDAENQSFQDVWFIDKGMTSGTFENSNNSPSSGWDSKPNPKKGGGTGIKNDYSGNTGARIELAFGGIQPAEGWPTISEATPSDINLDAHDVFEQFVDALTGTGYNDWSQLLNIESPSFITLPSFYDIEETNSLYSTREGKFAKNIAVGSQFRFKEDPLGTIYTMTDVDVFFKLRYENIFNGLIDDRYRKGNDNWVEGTDWSQYARNEAHSGSVWSLCTKATLQQAYNMQTYAKMGHALILNASAPGTGSINSPHETGGAQGDAYVLNSTQGYGVPWVYTQGEMFSIYKTSSYLRASNFTKNYRIWLDKKLTWNPAERLGNSPARITGGQTVTLSLANTTHGGVMGNWVDVTSTKAVTGEPIVGPMARAINPNDPDFNLYDGVRKVEIGMVLDNAPDGTNILATDSTKLPMVSKIEIGGGTGGSHRIWFKNYYGGNTLIATGAGSMGNGGATSGATVVFSQYSFNGLSPNSAKNMNYFRNGIGFPSSSVGVEAGTDAVGYTIEFIKEKSYRPDDSILPANPAIWETEPKKQESELDIYHAISDFTPININDPGGFIPIGSIIQHENSDAIPPGTKITGVTEDGQITLDREITIDPTDPGSGNIPGGEPTWGNQIA